MKTRLVVNLVAVLWLLSAQFAQAVSPTPAEMAEVRRWAAAKFEGVPDTKDPDFGLQVMANNGPVQANGRGGQPLRIGDKQYTRGLYCHAVSKVIVRLPSPGKTFTALAGGDRNAGGGSVVFSVSVGEKSLFKSGLMRGGMPGVEPFFSFTYDGKPSAELLKTWELKRASRPLDDKRTQHTLTYADPKTGLTIRCVGIEYRDFPTVEWTLYFKNASAKDTHHQTGSPCLATDYQPLETVLASAADKQITTSGGRPTNSDLPYFNLQLPNGEGMIVVVGWAGQWAARFTRDKENRLQVRAGQELTHFKLLPGEEVRSPMIVLQFWKGDRIRSQNVWRRWMLAHNVPRPGGKPLAPMLSACNGNLYPGIITNAAEELHFMRRYLEEGIKPDYWWQDAGWYPCDPVGWPKTGTWEVEPKRWPKGIREVSQASSLEKR